jgi:hypothetical protein
MINKETYLKALQLICLDAGLEFSGEKGAQLLKGKILLFEEFLADFTNEDFQKATLQIIKKETFYNKIPQVKVFIDYCTKEKEKRTNKERSIKIELFNNQKQKLITDIYKHFTINKGDYLFHSLASEFRSYDIKKIEDAFNNLKKIDRPQIDDWRREFNKKEIHTQTKTLIMPNFKANR